MRDENVTLRWPPFYARSVRVLFLRSLILAFAVFATLFGLEFFLEWQRAGYPGVAELSWAHTNNAKLVDVLSPMARAYNNVLSMLLGLIGLAIPLTANMHTPKLIDIFLRDRINRLVLSFMALGAAHVLWVAYMIGPEFAPTWAIAIAVYASILGWAVLIPYFFYVVRFLDPSRIIHRLRDEILRTIKKVAAGKADPVRAQEEISLRISQLGTIILKSLDRDDRDVAREGVWSLKQLIDAYATHKGRLPPGWFKVDRADFVGLSAEALDMMSEDHTWFEMKCQLQLELGYQRALGAASDSVSSISDATRVIAQGALERGDRRALELCVRFFNNFLREAIKARNLRAVYDVFHQYRLLGRELTDEPELLRDIGRYFSYYAVMARSFGMLFAPQLAVFDLGYMVRRAYEAGSQAAPELLAEVLAMPHRSNDDVHSLAVKAKLILGGFFLAAGKADEAAQVQANLADIDADEIGRAERDLLEARRAFFEVTDRQLNLEYLPPERREPLRQFCARLLGREPSTAGVVGAAADA